MQYLLLILVICLLGFAVGNPVVNLIRYSDDRDLNKYSYDFEVDNGISRSESGEIKTKNNEDILSVSGSYQYTENGRTYIVTYTANEDGYRPIFRIENASPLSLPQKPIIAPSVAQEIGSAVLASLAGGGLG